MTDSPDGESRDHAAAPNELVSSERQTLGRFHLQRRLGSGGMGSVFLAVDGDSHQTVALKILPRSKSSNATLVKRFELEAKAAAQLHHENIVTILDTGEIDGYPYIALEYVEGTDVHNLVKQLGVIPIRRSTEIVKQVAKALEHASAKGIVHRDIKPSNLLINRDGVVKLTDLGLARSVEESAESDVTRAGTTVGTVDFMSPEQARNSKSADVRSDIYSLGCAWHQMLTGSPPFPSGSLTNKLFAHASKTRPDPRELNRAIPEQIVDIMHIMMARNARDRYQTPTELLDALNSLEWRPRKAPASTAQPTVELNDEDTLDRYIEEHVESPPESVELPNRPRRTHTAEIEIRRTRIVRRASAILTAVAVVAIVWWLIAETLSERDRIERLPQNDGVKKSDDVDVRDNVRVGTAVSSVEDDGPEKSLDPLIDRSPVDVLRPSVDLSTDTIIEAERLPEWAERWSESEKTSGLPEFLDLPRFQVGRGNERTAQFQNLDTALRSASIEGAVIELAGDGPFFLRPIDLAGNSQIVIGPARDNQPVIVLDNSEALKERSVLKVTGGSLVLTGVHLVVVDRRFPRNRELTLVEVAGGNLTVVDSSVTLLGHRSAATVAFHVTHRKSTPDPERAERPRVYLERVVVRGGELTAFASDGSPLDLVAINCLFATGKAPAIVLTHGSTDDQNGEDVRQVPSDESDGNDDASVRPARIDRVLRFFSCTVATARSAFVLGSGVRTAVPSETFIHSRHSLFAADFFQSEESQLLELVNWPTRSASAGGGSAIQYLTWTVHESLATRWTRLVYSQTDSSVEAKKPADWNRLWGSAGSGFRYHPTAFINRGEGNLDELIPQSLDQRRMQANVIADDGSLMGCDVDVQRVPQDAVLKEAVALSERPSLPSRLAGDDAPDKVVPVDASADDLGLIVSRDVWPNNTTFLISGTGACKSSPIRIRGRSIRLQFSRVTDEPFYIEPRLIPVNRDDASDRAFIYVEDGWLDIVGGEFRFPTSADHSPARWFLKVAEGDFSLRGTTIKGPMREGGTFSGLIRWVHQPGQRMPSDTAGVYEHYGRVSDSFLSTAGTIIHADVQRQGLVCSNSLFVGSGDIFELDLPDSTPYIGGAIRLDRCTACGGRDVFHVNPMALKARATAPLRLFVRECVFARPDGIGAGTESPHSVAFCSRATRLMRQIEWWGDSNGYSAQTAPYLRSPSNMKGENDPFDSVWRSAWGQNRIHRPLVGESVVLSGQPTDLITCTADEFEVAHDSPSATWTSDGQPIGISAALMRAADLGEDASDLVGDQQAIDSKPNKSESAGSRKTPVPKSANRGGRRELRPNPRFRLKTFRRPRDKGSSEAKSKAERER